MGLSTCRRVAVLVALSTTAIVACGDTEQSTIEADRCLVRLHGKGASGADPLLEGSVAIIAPDGNGEAWGDREWRYATEPDLMAATDIVREAAEAAGCERVVLHGFSNGGAFAAALACSGESFDGRLVGVVIDDPVTDAASVDCRLAAGVQVALYWTGALAEQAPVGTECNSIDWTCSGPVIRGIEAMSDDLDVAVTASPFTDHVMNVDAPEPREWLATGS